MCCKGFPSCPTRGVILARNEVSAPFKHQSQTELVYVTVDFEIHKLSELVLQLRPLLEKLVAESNGEAWKEGRSSQIPETDIQGDDGRLASA